MIKNLYKNGIYTVLILSVFLFSGCKEEEPLEIHTLNFPNQTVSDSFEEETIEQEPVITEETEPRIRVKHPEVEKMVNLYANYGDSAEAEIEETFESLRSEDPETAAEWAEIFSLWKTVNEEDPDGYNTLNYNVLPDGLSDGNDLCLVVLGYQLNSDGSMKDELLERLKVVKASAEKYPNSYILCTGGGTASQNRNATEAGEMKKWLIKQGIDENRIIVENRSMTTSENASKSLKILNDDYPQVTKIAVISSDYHIPTGVLLFGAENILEYKEDGENRYEIVSNAAYNAPSGSLSIKFQARSLMELYEKQY